MFKGKMPLIIALVMGALAFVTAYMSIKSREREVRKGWNTVKILVAGKDITEGTKMTYEMVAQRDVPEQFVTDSVVKPENLQFIVNQKVLVPLKAGDILLWSSFETSKGFERLSNSIPENGWRAITIKTSGDAAVGGWIRPNDHIDIVGTFRDPSNTESVTLTIFRNVLVLATGKITGTTNVNLLSESDRKYGDITLLMLPEEAEMMILAQELGTLSTVLRNPKDIDTEGEAGKVTLKTVLTGERTKDLVKKRVAEGIQVIKGSQSSSDKAGMMVAP